MTLYVPTKTLQPWTWPLHWYSFKGDPFTEDSSPPAQYKNWAQGKDPGTKDGLGGYRHQLNERMVRRKSGKSVHILLTKQNKTKIAFYCGKGTDFNHKKYFQCLRILRTWKGFAPSYSI